MEKRKRREMKIISKRKTQLGKEEGVVTGQFEDEEDEPIEFTKRGWVL